MKASLNTIVHYVLSAALLFIVVAELMQPSTVTSVYEALAPITYLVGNHVGYFIDVTAIRGDKQNVIAYLTMLYIAYSGLYAALYIRVLQAFKDKHVSNYPIDLRNYYRFQCLTFYSRWAPLLLPHCLSWPLFIGSKSISVSDKPSTFFEALRGYAMKKEIWILYVFLLLGLHFFLARDPSFLNGKILHIPIEFKLTTLLLISVQASILFDILVFLSAIVAGNKRS